MTAKRPQKPSMETSKTTPAKPKRKEEDLARQVAGACPRGRDRPDSRLATANRSAVLMGARARCAVVRSAFVC